MSRERRTPTAWRTLSGTSGVPASASPRSTSSTKNALPPVRAWTRAATSSSPSSDAGERGDVVLSEPAQPDAVQRAVALEVGERAGERAAAAELGVAVGADDLQRAGAGRAQHEAREQQRAAVGPVEVVDDQQQRRALGERGVDGVEQAVARAGVVGRAGLERVGGAGLAQRLGERLERRERLLRAAAEQDGGAVGERGGGELVGESGLADARLAGQQHEPAVAVHLHAGPGRAQPLELGAAADELGRVGALQRSRRRDGAAGARRSSSSSARVSRDGGMPSEPRRRSANRSPAASAAARSPALASRSISRRFGSSASGSSATCSRVRRTASAGSRGRRELLERVGESLRVRLASVVGPVVVEAVEDRRAARRQRGGGVAGVERRGERARVDAAPSSATVSRPATRWSAAGPSARRSSVSAARRLVRADSSRTSGQKRAASWARACGPGCSAR